ncbi:MAG: hypothetical protein AB7G11_01310 [Phycisphaerales bacterium]
MHAQSYSIIEPEYRGNTGFGQGGAAGVMDFDSDGVPDVVVGAPYDDAGVPSIGDAGRCYLFSGRTGARLGVVSAPTPHAFGHFGQSLTSLGDINRDGFGDYAVGEYGFGNVYVLSGADHSIISTLTYPPSGGGAFGISIASVEDPTRGSVASILIGAPYWYGETGRVYVYSMETGQPELTLHSPNPRFGAVFGLVVAVTEDLDGDTHPDFLIYSGSELRPDGIRRSALVAFSGVTGAYLRTFFAPNLDIFQFPYRYSGVPDLDGDGLADVLVGDATRRADGASSGSGVAFVYSGGTGQLLYTLVSPSPDGGFYFGDSVLGLPDMTGDGFGDLLVTARYDSLTGYAPGAGASYIFSGRTGELYRAIGSPEPRPNGASGEFGRLPTLIPDTSGDERPDLVLFSLDNCSACWQPEQGYIFHSCAADFNYDGVLNSQDFYDFLVAFFGGPISYNPDFNRDGAVNTQDFFDYFTAFLGGCP